MDKEDVVLKHNAILVSHKRQCNNGIYSNMDAHRDFILNEVSQKKKRQIQCNITYMQNLKYDTNELIDKTETDSQDTDKELTVTKGKKAWGRHKLGVWDQQIQNTMYKTDKQQGATVQYREVYLISYNKP